MMMCKKCKTQFEGDIKFCPNCGGKLKEIKSSDGSKMEVSAVVNKKFSKKWFVIGGSGLVLIAVAVLIVMFLMNGSSKSNSSNSILYIKDNELFYPSYSSEKAMQITSRLFDFENLTKKDVADSKIYIVRKFVSTSKDGKIIFYPDKLDTNSSYDSANIYYRFVNKPNEEAYKLDSDIRSYDINSDSDTVVYLKNNNNTLYIYNISNQQKEKIDSEVYDYIVSEDGNKVLYLGSDYGLYIFEKGKGKEKLDRDVEMLENTDYNFSTFYYLKDNTIYRKTAGSDKEKISDKAGTILRVYNDGGMYYTKISENTTSYYDLVEDDLLESDSSIKEPEKPYPPERLMYDTLEEYQKAYAEYQKEYSEFEDLRNKYGDKEKRDNFRKNLSDKQFDNTISELYYYDGKESKLVDANFGYRTSISSEVPVLMYTTPKTDEKIKFSDIYQRYNSSFSSLSMNDVYTEIYKKYNQYNYFIATKDKNKALQYENVFNAIISNLGNEVYFAAADKENSSNDYKDLYKISISDDKIGEPELYDTDVYLSTSQILENGKLFYFKDVRSLSGSSRYISYGDLYTDKKIIDSDVGINTCTKYQDKLFYQKDFNKDSGNATLKMYKNGNTTKISDDANEYYILSDGTIVYIHDYSNRSYEGDFYVCHDNNAVKLDTDVQALVNCGLNDKSKVLATYKSAQS